MPEGLAVTGQGRMVMPRPHGLKATVQKLMLSLVTRKGEIGLAEMIHRYLATTLN